MDLRHLRTARSARARRPRAVSRSRRRVADPVSSLTTSPIGRKSSRSASKSPISPAASASTASRGVSAGLSSEAEAVHSSGSRPMDGRAAGTGTAPRGAGRRAGRRGRSPAGSRARARRRRPLPRRGARGGAGRRRPARRRGRTRWGRRSAPSSARTSAASSTARRSGASTGKPNGKGLKRGSSSSVTIACIGESASDRPDGPARYRGITVSTAIAGSTPTSKYAVSVPGPPWICASGSSSSASRTSCCRSRL